ncbi:tetratricopeptide repeat protein [Herbidospora sp. NEAU-GS84]|uniref:Tetratricopeptide repeat protein n=1 Tax=Herbidospora solisilvae TaxID=2696284 RepID=A0A7C9JHZ2_9ACTN|nr:tetratricopeptide repeat protein [Herbidospora solisilvae]NAS27081.1 tetratricopeptide repeat protein [Herbidospora solisilvae]
MTTPGDADAGDDTLTTLLPLLARRLRADRAGQEALSRLTDDPRDATLTQWLESRGAPTMATVVTGGYVEKLVTIAHADSVHIEMPAEPPPLPADLPAVPGDFTDRDAELREALTHMTASGGLLTVSGLGGIGKSAFATRVAAGLAGPHGGFGGAQLYADLRGHGDDPRDPGEVLTGFLRSLGVPESRIPHDLDQRASLYRTALGRGRSIVLLDNARDERQVRPLLAGAGHAVLVTSRRPLAALEGALSLPLPALPAGDGLALLAAIAGPDRVGAEPEAAAETVRLCGGLPLAIRIVAGKLAVRRHWRVSRMAAALAAERTRLGELSLGDLDVKGSFMLSYRDIGPDAQRALRLSGFLGMPSFPGWLLAALLDVPVGRGEELAEELAELHLLEPMPEDATGELRYRHHDLLRLFAAERSMAEDSESERRAAVERALGALLAIAKRALYFLSPHSKRDPDPTLARLWPLPADHLDRLAGQPYAWFESEYDTLIAAIARAHGEGLWECAWELADSMHYFFRVRALWADWVRTHELALEAVRAAGNARGEGWTLRNLGNAYRDQGDLDRAAECFRLCLELFDRIGNRLGQAAALNNLGELAMDRGRLAEAREYLERCLPAWDDVGDAVGVAYVTNHLGWVTMRQGDGDAAAAYFARSLPRFRELGDRWGEAHALRSLGVLARERGDLAAAEEPLTVCARLFAEHGDPAGQARSNVDLAWVLALSARHRESSALLDRAQAVFGELSDSAGVAWCLLVRAELLLAEGDGTAASAALEEAAATFRDRDELYEEGLARTALAAAYARTGHGDRARRAYDEAITTLAESGASAWLARARRERAELSRA